jgi:hypothetical protein
MSDYGRISEELARAVRYIAELEGKIASLAVRAVATDPDPQPMPDPMNAPEPAV